MRETYPGCLGSLVEPGGGTPHHEKGLGYVKEMTLGLSL